MPLIPWNVFTNSYYAEVAHPFIYICRICLPHRRDCVTRSFVVPSFWVVEKSLWDVYQHWCSMARTKNWISDKLLWKCVLKNMLYLYDYNNKHDTPESVNIHRGRCKTMLGLQIVIELGLQDLYINTLLFWQIVLKSKPKYLPNYSQHSIENRSA